MSLQGTTVSRRGPEEPGEAPRRPINVAMFTPSAFGGHARYSQELLTALAEVGTARGVKASLVTSEDLADDHHSDAYAIHAVLPRLVPRSEFRGKVFWAASRLSHYPRRELALFRWVTRGEGLDVLHAQEMTPWIAPWLYGSLRRRGVAVVETVHNIHAHDPLNKAHRAIAGRLSRASWRRCDALLVHTEGLKSELADFLGAGHPPIFVTPHGVWNVVGDAGVKPATDPLAPLLFFGVVRENKGLHVLIRALGKLPRHRLIVAGHFPSASYQEEILSLIHRQAPARVEVLDRFVTEAEAFDLFESAGLVVLPYTAFASQSGVLHQAMAHGRPVVVSDVGALGESVRAWGVGGVVPAEDDGALASAILEATVPERFRRFAAATSKVRESLSWSRTAEKTIDAYEAAVLARRESGCLVTGRRRRLA